MDRNKIRLQALSRRRQAKHLNGTTTMPAIAETQIKYVASSNGAINGNGPKMPTNQQFVHHRPQQPKPNFNDNTINGYNLDNHYQYQQYTNNNNNNIINKGGKTIENNKIFSQQQQQQYQYFQYHNNENNLPPYTNPPLPPNITRQYNPNNQFYQIQQQNQKNKIIMGTMMTTIGGGSGHHQQQPHSRIPINKHGLNEIYEKHLLNQTKFDNTSRDVYENIDSPNRSVNKNVLKITNNPLMLHNQQQNRNVLPEYVFQTSSGETVGLLGRRENPIGGNNTNNYEFSEAEKNISVEFEYPNRNSKINLMLETAQAIAAAAYYARTAQKMTSSASGTNKNYRTSDVGVCDRGGYCGAIQRAPPPMPPVLARRLANKENPGLGKVKVMLRVSDDPPDISLPSYLSIDKKKRQVTLSDPSTITTPSPGGTTQERGPMVAAPKMFAFDSLFTTDDTQTDVCSSALSEVIPAVLEGSDGCLLTLGYPGAGQTKTMFGSIASAANELGAIPCAISWLYKGINEKRQKSGARFSVRVSALGVNATKPGSTSKDLLAAHATESDDSPGVYLRDDFLGGPTELRAPTPERAALFLDAALAGRPHGSLDPAFIFTLHVYQYSLAGRGGVAGGRSRLHLIDLGGCANRSGGLPLSGIGNTFLSILSGQRHPPNKDHPLTPLLKDCLAPLTCHVAVIAHVLHSQTHTDALTTIQLASRIHRMRRRKHRFPISVEKQLQNANANQQSGGSSEGPDPSSSDFSADTVIYMGPSDEQTDGEHPPVYLPSLGLAEDNRCAMNKALKGSGAEKPSKIPSKTSSPANSIIATIAKPQSPITTATTTAQRTDSLKRNQSFIGHPHNNDIASISSPIHGSPIKLCSSNMYASPQKLQPSSPFKYSTTSTSKGSNVPTPKGSPLRRPNLTGAVAPESPAKSRKSEEKWIDGPRVSRAKVAEARHLLREINHVKQCETWIDGPNTKPTRSLTANSLPGTNTNPGGYGFMDSHKKTMIRQWVENQTTQILTSQNPSPVHQPVVAGAAASRAIYATPQQKTSRSECDQMSDGKSSDKIVDPLARGLNVLSSGGKNSSESCIRTGLVQNENDVQSEKSLEINVAVNLNNDSQGEEEDQDSGPSEVPPALPLIEPLSSREISHDSLHLICSRHMSRESVHSHSVQMMDCGLQVTEEEIARTMGCEHPLSALSHGEISVVSSFNVGDAFSECGVGDRTRHQFDQLARLREIFTSQLAMAEVTPAYKIGDAGSVYSEPAFRYTTGAASICSEPPYRPPSPTRCRGCRQSNTHLSRTPSQASLPSLNALMQFGAMDQYASLRHPDGASDPNLQQKSETPAEPMIDLKTSQSLEKVGSFEFTDKKYITPETPLISQTQLPQLQPLSLGTPEAYDSGHDSTPRTSKHSGISRRAESGYHSVATVRDSDESSFGSGVGSRAAQKITAKKKKPDKSLCHWLRNPFTCTYPDTEGEVSDF